VGKAKKNREQNTKILLGKRVRFLGLFGATRSCSYCGTTKGKGMFSEYKEQYYCNEDCIRMELLTKAE
jgi:hypothetical protein